MVTAKVNIELEIISSKMIYTITTLVAIGYRPPPTSTGFSLWTKTFCEWEPMPTKVGFFLLSTYST